MKLEHSFSVPVAVDDAWQILLDIERIGPCMPGATIESVDGDDFTGNVKVKLGPMSLTYKGKASFVEKDAAAHRAVIDARGRDARGNGTAAAKITAVLTENGDGTKVVVETDLDITGKPAQFGRGVMADVGNKLIGQFADCLASTIGAPEAQSGTADSTDGAAAAAPAAAKRARPRPARAAKAAADDASAGAAAPDEVTVPVQAAVDPDAATEALRVVAETPGYAAPSEPSPVPEQPRPAEPATVPSVPSVPSVRSAPSAARPAGTSVNGSTPRREAEPIDLLEHAGPAIAKRLAPLVVALVILVVLLRRRRG